MHVGPAAVAGLLVCSSLAWSCIGRGWAGVVYRCGGGVQGGMREQSGLGSMMGFAQMDTSKVVTGCLVISGQCWHEGADGANCEKGE